MAYWLKWFATLQHIRLPVSSLVESKRKSMTDALQQAAHYRFTFLIAVLCVFWYTISAASGIVNKMLLHRFHHPVSATMSSLLAAALGSIPIVAYIQHKHDQHPHHHQHPQPQFTGIHGNIRKISPVAIGKILALSFQFISYWKVSVSYVHTIKATMPVFSVVCAYFWLGEHHTCKVYLSLVPVVLGVVIATLTELSFDMVGFISTILATFTYALLNILVKKILHETAMHPLQLLCVMSQIGAIFLFPFWAIYDVYPIVLSVQEQSPLLVDESGLTYEVLVLLLASGMLDFVQNLLAFYLIHHLTAVSYAVTCTAKRGVVIIASLLVLRNPVTYPNMVGMCIAVAGVYLYNRAKQRQHDEEKHAEPTRSLPFTLSDATLLQKDVDSESEDDERDDNANTVIPEKKQDLNNDAEYITIKHQRG